MVLKKKKEIQVDAFVLDQQQLEDLQSFADSEGQNLASLLLRCGMLTDGIQQIHCIKQVVPLLQKMDATSVCDPMVKNCIDILGVIFLTLDIKNPLKKVLASSLNGLPESLLAEATHSFVDYLREELKTTDVSQYRKIMENLVSCVENTNIGKLSLNTLLKEALQFLQKALLDIEDKNRQFSGNRIAQTQLMHDLLMGVKVSMMLIQKLQANIQEDLWKKVDSPIWKIMCRLLNSFTCFLINEELLQTVQTTAGLALVLFIKTMFESAEKLPCLISDLLCGSVKCSDIPDWFMDSCGSLCTAELSDSVLLFLCHGSLAMLEWRNGVMGQNGVKLLLDIASVLLTLSTRLKESNMAASLSRILAIWTNSALSALQSSFENPDLSLSGNSHTIRKMLDYVYAHWEHPLDAVRHQTKLIFKNILQIHLATIKESAVKPDPFLLTLTESLLNLEWHVKGKYSSLGCLVECIGCDNVLTMDRTIPAQILDVMSDQSFAPYASDLLETMFMSHKKHLTSVMGTKAWIDSWHETWVSPLLLILCDGNSEQATYITDYYLPRLLKCSPESLNYMIKILQTSAGSSIETVDNLEEKLKLYNLYRVAIWWSTGSCNTRGALGALMACLRTARAHGHLQFAVIMHDGLVSVGCIKQGLVHQHDQVRIDALGLLCESHRSTEIISLEEMQLIKFFIRYNLNSQSPAVRQQICSLLKKFFCRIYESSQTIYKMQQMKPKQDPDKLLKWSSLVTLEEYKDFMSSLCVLLFGALFPGSSHPTRFTALTVLGIIAEIFPDSEGQSQVLFQVTQEVDPGRVQTLLQCFASTFEEVKILAFELLMKFHCARPYLQDPEKMQPLFQVAMQLSTSTKPYDCVTASYLLNFLVHQEGLLQVCFKNHLLVDTFQPDKDISSNLVEKNTLAVIKYLLENLEGEIVQAEKSLLQAAASFPLYGRVHCITGTLHQLPLHNLTLISEWKQIVAKLILMSFKLSAVVSPVVQSSSPEGLIPMDTDSDTSERLQLVLREIQPCDTNDYFTEAKLLKEHSELDCDSERAENICAETRGEEQQTCDVTAQMVLVCCWRSMKEISLLLGKLCQLLPLQAVPDCSDVLITVEQVKDIGEYFKHHLLKSRHRGAFELAYSGFIKLTEVFSRCNNESLQRLPQQWLFSVLEEIKSSNPASKLCATRRSAGIPFYIQALLASEPKKGKTGLLKMTLKELISLASPSNIPQSSVPQVHALNILRALFKDTRLGENIIPYVADGVRAAVLGFTSSVWAVRNSSTLLFSTLITRIFGVKRGKDENAKKNRMTGREFFTRFPNLYPFLLNQLEVVASTMESEGGGLKLHPSLFLILLILGKLYPSPMDGTYSALSMAPFIPFILKCGHSAVYRSREMAGRALVPFIMTNQVPQTVKSLLAGLPNCTDLCVRQNAVHGTLIQVFHLLQSYLESKRRANSDFQQGLSDILSSVEAKLWLAKRQNPCLVTRATYLDVLILLSNYIGKSRIKGAEFQKFWEKMATIVSDSELATGITCSSAVPGLAQYLQSITKLLISMLSVTDPGFANCNLLETGIATSPCLLFTHLLHSDFHEVRLLVFKATLRWLKQMCCKHMAEGGEKGILCLLSGLEEMLLRIAIKEKHPECFCKVLEVLYCMDFRKVLPKTENAIKMNPRDFLHWIMNIAEASDSIEIQSISLKLASKLIIHLVQNWQEELKSEMKLWVQIVTYCCEDEQQTDLRLAAADVLVTVAPFFLTSQNLILGVSDTLLLWKCVIQLLQSEEQIVRDAAADVIRVALSQENISRNMELDFHVVNASMALDLTFSILCELLQQWKQMSAGIPVLLEWLLGREDLKDLETTALVGNDYLFDKGQTNFWAEKLTHARQLSEHLLQLIPVTHVSPCDQEKLQQLTRSTSDQAQLVTQLLKKMPPVPEFSRSVEFTKLAIQKERISICLNILTLLDA